MSKARQFGHCLYYASMLQAGLAGGEQQGDKMNDCETSTKNTVRHSSLMLSFIWWGPGYTGRLIRNTPYTQLRTGQN